MFLIFRRRKILLMVFAVFVLLVAAVAIVFRTAQPPKVLLEKMAERVDLQAKDVHYTQVGSSGTKWDITAKSVSYQKSGEIALFENVSIRLLMKGDRIFTMSADRGNMNTLSKDVMIEGNVVAVSDHGDTLKTKRLIYRDGTKKVETDQPVVIENRRTRISGVGMVIDLTDDNITILSRVRSKTVMY